MSRLPHHSAHPFVTDGGLETDLIFHHGEDLPHFAAFPLVRTADGRRLLESYYEAYASTAATARAGLLLETGTWRASTDWGALLGWSAGDVAAVNVEAVEQLRQLATRYLTHEGIQDVLVVGTIGPRRDGYAPDLLLQPDEAATYHSAQLAALAQGGADLATGYTFTHVGEAVGLVWAARDVGLPVAVSFTVETDGRLPDGTTLADAVRAVDDAAAPDYFGVNCAHPRHIDRALGAPADWHDRIVTLRPNASLLSHAELDEAEGLDEGDPETLVADVALIRDRLPQLNVLGGCCGTDSRHVDALWRHGSI
ncbi:homocysteine S-methyltransferase family protein [Dermatophilaceae bacterium Soc4.6]